MSDDSAFERRWRRRIGQVMCTHAGARLHLLCFKKSIFSGFFANALPNVSFSCSGEVGWRRAARRVLIGGVLMWVLRISARSLHQAAHIMSERAREGAFGPLQRLSKRDSAECGLA